MEQDLNRLSISSHHYKLSNTSVQAFCAFISSFLDLFVTSSLLDEVQYLGIELSD